jgi:hypothetical protein
MNSNRTLFPRMDNEAFVDVEVLSPSNLRPSFLVKYTKVTNG